MKKKLGKMTSSLGDKFRITADMAKKRLKAIRWLRKPIDLDKLTPNEQRVLIAKDVLATLDAKKFKATAGLYTNFDKATFRSIQSSPLGTDLRMLYGKTRSCQVCAKGAVFVAAVARFDQATVGNSDMDEILQRYFPLDADEMENAFEGRYADSSYSASY